MATSMDGSGTLDWDTNDIMYQQHGNNSPSLGYSPQTQQMMGYAAGDPNLVAAGYQQQIPFQPQQQQQFIPQQQQYPPQPQQFQQQYMPTQQFVQDPYQLQMQQQQLQQNQQPMASPHIGAPPPQ